MLSVVILTRRTTERVPRATAIGLFLWLLMGLVLFSQQARLHPRYVEASRRPWRRCLGIGALALVAGAPGRVRWLALPLTALLALPPC